GADHLDDFVDVQQRDQQALDQVRPLGLLRQTVLAPAAHHRDAVVHVDLQQLPQTQCAGLAVHQGYVVDTEGLLHRRVLVQLLQHRLGMEPVLDFDDHAQAVLAVGEVVDVGDALQLLGLYRRLDLGDHPLRPHLQRQFGDHDALFAGCDPLDAGGRARAEGATPGGIGLPDAVQPHDLPATGQVRTGDETHQLLQVRLRMADQVPGRADDLHQVVRGHVRGHSHGDPAGTVDQQVRGGRG